MNPAPDHIKQAIVHVLDAWAEAAPDTIGLSAFAMHLPNKTDWIGQGYTMRTPTIDLALASNIGRGVSGVVRKSASRGRMLDYRSGGFAQLDRRLSSYAATEWFQHRIFRVLGVADFCGISGGRGG